MNSKLNIQLLLFVIACITYIEVSGQTPELQGKYILVMDMQENGTQKQLNKELSAKLIDDINQIIARADTDKVIYVESIMASLSISLTKLTVNFEPGLALDDRLLLVGNTKVIKTKANAFTANDLRTFIQKTGASEFVIVGLMAEHCVKETVLGGIKEGYSISVIPDAVAGESLESKKATLKELENAGAKTLTLSEIKMPN